MKFFELVKEVLYDIVGYIFPGTIVLFLLYISFNNGNIASPMYNLLTNVDSISKYTKLLKVNFSYIPAILITSYLLGHIPKHIANFINEFFKHFNKMFKETNIMYFMKKLNFFKDNNNSYLEVVENHVYNELNTLLDFKFNNNDQFENFLSTYSTTTSRFKNHNNLMQKYIAKYNFYSSISCILLLLLSDIIISSIIVWFNSKQFINIKLIFFLFIITSISYVSFYNEFKRHKILKHKESLLFLYETLIYLRFTKQFLLNGFYMISFYKNYIL